MQTFEITASEVEEGHFLVGVGNGYVIDVDTRPDVRNGDDNTTMGEGSILITFNDQYGDENYLLIGPDVLLTVSEG